MPDAYNKARFQERSFGLPPKAHIIFTRRAVRCAVICLGLGKSIVPIEIASEPLLGLTGIEGTSQVLKITLHLEAALRRL
jgi:hypothetical protein